MKNKIKDTTPFMVKFKRKKRYECLIWRDQSGICFKIGYEYGIGCFQTSFPFTLLNRGYVSIPILKTI